MALRKLIDNANTFTDSRIVYCFLLHMSNFKHHLLEPRANPKQEGFQLLYLIIPELKSHVIPYKFNSSHWLKLQHSDWRANLVKDFFDK